MHYEIAVADSVLLAIIDAARKENEDRVKAFKDKSEAVDRAMRESLGAIMGTVNNLAKYLMGRSVTVTGELYARTKDSTDSPFSYVLDPIAVGDPGVNAVVTYVGFQRGSDLRGYYLDYLYSSRTEHEGIDEISGRKYDLPENPIHGQLCHTSRDGDFMFKLDPYLILEMGEEARSAAGIAELDDQRPDTKPVIAFLSRVALKTADQ